MARMHSRKRGKSGSKKPLRKSAPTWLRYKPAEVEMIVSKLTKEGKSPSQIGTILRDIYGIPSIRAAIGKKITLVLKEKKLLHDIPEDLTSLMRKYVLVKKHLDENKKDQTARRGLLLTNSKIKRLSDYYKGTGRLPAEWKFDPAKIRLLIE